ncbi:hypothetical protein ACG7TL_002151 [Trametes sanguinea]
MQFRKPSALLAALVGCLFASSSLVASQLVIDTPDDAVQRVPTVVEWTGAPGSSTTDSRFKEFGNLPADQDSFTWQTDVRAGTKVLLRLNDAAGDIAQSAGSVIQDGRKLFITPHITVTW